MRLSAKIQRGHWYRPENHSQIKRPWIIPNPFQLEFGTGERGLAENVGQILARFLGGRRFGEGRRDERMMNHFGNAVKCSTAQSFLNELFIFWSELNRHDSTLRPDANGVNSMISLRDVDRQKSCARAVKGLQLRLQVGCFLLASLSVSPFAR